jgi:hypothetical protein
MKKIRISIQETLKYHHELIIEVPEGTTDDEIDKALTRSERMDNNARDVGYTLEKLLKAKEIEFIENDLGSPYDTEIEIDDFQEVKENA